jgi:hypothetical protein
MKIIHLKALVFLLAAIGGTGAGVAHASAGLESLKPMVAKLDRASANGDRAGLAAVRAELAALAFEDPKVDALRRYYIAFALYRGGALGGDDWARWLSDCIETTRSIVTERPEFADAHALQAACAGSLIGADPKRAMVLSSLSRQALERALSAEPKNPRVMLIEATNTLFTPPQFGGGPANALRLFEQAAQRFDALRSSGARRLPDWGHDEAYMWIGVVHSIAGNTKAALAALTTASELNPNNVWIRQRLIPAAKRGESLGPMFGFR